MNTITIENIKNLDAKKLTQLLLKILYLENNKFRFPDCNIYVPENITTADGVEDGRILTSDFKNSLQIFSRNNDFSFKYHGSQEIRFIILN